MKTANQDKPKEFPRKGMKYNDRFRMTVQEFGRLIVIDLNRGTAVCSDDGKQVTIKYEDDETRKASTKSPARKKAAVKKSL